MPAHPAPFTNVLILTAALLAGCAGELARDGDSIAEGDPAGITPFDCAEATGCAAWPVLGAPAAELPDGSPSPRRGTVDASISADGSGTALFATYTAVSVHIGTGSVTDNAVSIQLAESSDGGTTWSHAATLRASAPETDPVSGAEGYAGYEVSSLENSGGTWYLANLRFHDPRGGGNNRRVNSFHLELARAATVQALAAAPVVRLGGSLAADSWVDHRLSDLDPALDACSLWLDPELFAEDGQLYLLALCVAYVGGTRRPEQSFYGLFALSDEVQEFGTPTWIGALTDAADAEALGGDELSKADLVTTAAGERLLLVAPVFQGALFEEYSGCYVLPVVSLNPPQLLRSGGVPVVRAQFVSSDSTPTAGSCAYHPASATGVLVTRREMLPTQGSLEWALHQTGLSL